MPPLYKLTEDLQQLYESLSTDEDGAIDEELANRLGQLSEQREDALIWLAKVAKSIAADADAYATHLDYLRKRERMLANRYDKLRQYIKDNLERLGETKVTRDGVTLRVQKNSQPTVCVPFMDRLPDAYKRYVEPEVDKSKIIAAVKAGVEVPGAEVITGTHLRIV